MKKENQIKRKEEKMKTKRRFFSFLFVFCLVLGLVPMTASAAETKDTWDGTTDIAWYNETDTVFHITTAEQLAGLAQLVNEDITTFAGKIIYLDNDLDLSGHEWVSIGYNANASNSRGIFGGTFDGQGHEISGLYSHEDYMSTDPDRSAHNTGCNGLFGSVNGGTIQNLGVTNADIFISEQDTSTYGMGIIADWFVNASMFNCYSTGSIMGGSYFEKYIGGLVGFAVGSNQVIGCYSSATITGNYSNSGNSYSESLEYYDSLGGIVGGALSGSTVISDCWFDGEIVVNSIQAAVGGIVGISTGTVVNNCVVATDSLGVDPYENTCWIAYVLDMDAENCYWPNDDKFVSTVSNANNESSAGTAVDDFQAEDVLSGLQAHAAEGITWVAGLDHPVFNWDEPNISADYSAVETVKDRIPDDLSLYTEETVRVLNEAVNSVVDGKSMRQQEEVNAMVQAIEDALAALEYKDADYSRVDEAIAKANALNKEQYVDFVEVEAAVNGVVRDKNITGQAEVDAMAQAIEDALAALEYKDADYSRVDEAIAKANALDKEQYKDFSAVEAAMNGVVRGKNITGQAEVDAMAQAIEDALTALEYKDSDHNKTDETITKDTGDTISNPERTATSATPDKAYSSPKTGDNSDLSLWISLIVVAALMGAAAYGRKRKCSII